MNRRATPTAPPGAYGHAARLAWVAALLLILTSASRWVLADLISPFGWAVIAIAVWALAIVVVIAVIASRRASADAAPRPAAPALLVVFAALLAIYGPWAELDMQARWRLLRPARERALEWLAREHPAPDARGMVRLPPALRRASATGGEVRLGATEADSLAVLFYTYRGVPDGWAGFLAAEGPAAPARFRGDSLLLSRPLAPGWAFAAGR